jgi:hypothetical protein
VDGIPLHGMLDPEILVAMMTNAGAPEPGPPGDTRNPAARAVVFACATARL